MIWFTSDQHFGHANIIKYCDRPFGYVDVMNAVIVDNYNDVVADDDIVFHLGDVVMSSDHLIHAARLKGRKILIPGNHDGCWMGHSKPNKIRKSTVKYVDAGFTVVGSQFYIRLNDQGVMSLDGTHDVTMCHFPYHGDHTEHDRYVEHRPVDEGLPLLCGHIHEKFRQQDRMFNVGVDVNGFMPVSGAEVSEWLTTLAK